MTGSSVFADQQPLVSVQEKDVVTNYHVTRILMLRRELPDALQQTPSAAK